MSKEILNRFIQWNLSLYMRDVSRNRIIIRKNSLGVTYTQSHKKFWEAGKTYLNRSSGPRRGSIFHRITWPRSGSVEICNQQPCERKETSWWTANCNVQGKIAKTTWTTKINNIINLKLLNVWRYLLQTPTLGIYLYTNKFTLFPYSQWTWLLLDSYKINIEFTLESLLCYFTMCKIYKYSLA